MVVYHPSALLEETLFYLNVRPGKIYVDCTLGGAGHAAAICNTMGPSGRLIGLDQDRDAIDHAEAILKPFEQNVNLFHCNYVNLIGVLADMNISGVDGILMDLGLSLHQLAGSGRGFSFKNHEPLDMRMDIRSKITAKAIIEKMEESKMADLFFQLGEERYSRSIARHIVAERKQGSIETSKQLAEIICQAIPARARNQQHIHPATRVFMALRIAVNQELERLNEFLDMVPGLLNSGGRLCVLSFHSLEDRMVKQRIRDFEASCICPSDFPVCRCNRKPVMRAITRKPIRPSPEEIDKNPISRSTRLRVAEKL
ncbi:MAG: 16S rRNA (cytosine(1402)-N(4))-methyltransferase RsmH [Desulfatirhabdiaceae bacterium]